MSSNGGTDRVSNKQLYEALWNFRQEIEQRLEPVPTTGQMYRAIGVALVVGQVAARFDFDFPQRLIGALLWPL